MSTRTQRWALGLIAGAILCPLAMAQNMVPLQKNQGYWLDGTGGFIGSATPGQCWHSGEWTPAMAVEPCDPVLKKAEVPMPKPPEVVAQAAPAPLPVAPPPAPMPKPLPAKMSFAADALFGFDKSALSGDGQAMLADLATQLGSTSYENVQVTGHTDRIGTTAYNLKLSERRAAAVTGYLVTKGVPSDRIVSKGVGESEPVIAKDACKSGKHAAIVDCLRADRRVEVEVSGTKVVQ